LKEIRSLVARGTKLAFDEFVPARDHAMATAMPFIGRG
jgi:hypothetical protein